jgi:hypothetical protein
MKRTYTLSIAVLAIAAGLWMTPASAQPKFECAHAIVLMLGVGY